MTVAALLIGAAPTIGAEAVVRREAQCADLVIGVDGGAALCRAAGVVPHVVVGDLDSLEPGSAAELRADGVRFAVFPADKDVSDLELAIAEARALGATSAALTAVTSGRLDHTLAAMGSLVGCSDLWPVLHEPGLTGWVLDPRHRASVALDTEGAVFSVVSFEPGASVSITGARWPLDRHSLAPLSSLGVGNVVATGGAYVRVHEGIALVTCTG